MKGCKNTLSSGFSCCPRTNWRSVGIANISAVVLLGVFYLWKWLAPDALIYHCQEDRVIENLTAMFFFFAGVGMSVAIWRNPSLRRKMIRLFFPICWVVLFFVFAGEEISWGQRIFGMTTPEVLQEANKQHELNIHNIRWVDEFLGGKYRFLSTMVLFTGVLMPLAAMVRGIRRFLVRLAFPVIQPHYIVFFLGGYVFGKFTHGDLGNNAAEIREFIFSVGYFLFAVHAAIAPRSIIDKPQSERRETIASQSG